MGRIQLGRFRGSVEHKSARELVSEVDKASERHIVRRIGEMHPGHAVLGEEGANSNGSESDYRWIIDPLDGTSNYLHGHPMFAVSLAVMHREQAVAGVVFLPYLSEVFCAARGVGAFLNSRTIELRVSTTAALDEAMIATGFAYDRERFDNYAHFVRLAKAARSIRRCGSAAIDLAYVAAGRYDAFWELGLRPWDVAAGALLIEEAGGTLSDFSGGDDWLEGESLIASNGKLHAAMRDLLSDET